MLEKIFNNYFTKKLLEEIKWCFIVRGLDYDFENDKNEIFIKVKNKKYSDENYSIIAHIKKSDSFKYMCDLDNFRKQIGEITNEYQKDNK